MSLNRDNQTSDEELDVRLRKAAVCIFLMTDQEQARPVADLPHEAATELQRVCPLLRDARRLLLEFQKRFASDELPARVNGLLNRIQA